MKTLKYFLTIAALTGALAISAKADLLFLGAIPFDNPNSPDHNKTVLEAFLGHPVGDLLDNFESGLSVSVDVTPGEFFVVHYGKGKGGSSKGGSFEFFQVINNETNVTFPQNGGDAGNDPYGHGGISSARGFAGEQGTPDSGTTAALLGLGLTGLAGLRARFGRK